MKGLSSLLTISVLAMIMLASIPFANAVILCGDSGNDVISGTINDDIVVGPDKCTIADGGTTVNGDVTVITGGCLDVEPDVTINGDMTAEEAEEVTIEGASLVTINGDIKITASTDDTFITHADVSGHIKIEDQDGGNIEVEDNLIDGDLKVENNEAGNIWIHDNDFPNNGNIKVKGNDADDGEVSVQFNGDGASSNPTNIKVEGNTAVEDVEVEFNELDGSLLVVDNESFGDNVEVEGNTIGDDLKVKDNDADFEIQVNDNNFPNNGNIKVEGNTADDDVEVNGNGDGGTNNPTDIVVLDNESFDDDVDVNDNTIDGNMKLKDNTADEDIEIELNIIAGDLTCTGNDPDPSLNSNTIGGTENCDD